MAKRARSYSKMGRTPRRAGAYTRRDVLKAALVAPLGAAALSGAGVTIDRFPYLQNVTSDAATLLWTTRQPGNGSVAFSSDSSFLRIAPAYMRTFLPAESGRPFTFYQYQARLTPLREGIQYFYRILVDGQNLTPAPSPSEELFFRTAARGPISFLVIGDSGEGSAQQDQIAKLMAKENNISFLLHSGDVAYPAGTLDTYEALLFAQYRSLMSRYAFYMAPGNHDYYTASATPYKHIVAPPTDNVPPEGLGLYYSFDWGDVHFVALDTNDPLSRAILSSGPMLDWLENDLQTTRKFWRIAFFHHPPYPTSSHHENDEVCAAVREYIVPILDRHGVPLVIAGHDHNYQREVPLRSGIPTPPGIGTQYVITGGGGAGLYPLDPVGSHPIISAQATQFHYVRVDIDGAKATIRATDVTGTEIDRVVVAPLPVASDAGVVNAASYLPAVAPGSLFTIYGSNLAYRDEQASTVPLPTTLSGVTLSIGSQNLPLVFVSPGQVNAQIPFTVSGYVQMTVTTPNGTSVVNVNVADASPGIFAGPAVVHNNSGALVTASNPAAQSEFVVIYATGLGRVDGTLIAGAPAPSSPLLKAMGTIEVRLGSVSLTPVFAGLAPGFVGLYQVAFQIPANMRSGSYATQVVVRGVVSNSITLAVGNPSGPGTDGGDAVPLAGLLRRLGVVPA